MFKCVISIASFLIKDDPNIPPFAEDIVLPWRICDSRLLVEKKREKEKERVLGCGGRGGSVSQAYENRAACRKQNRSPSGLKGDDSEPNNK